MDEPQAAKLIANALARHWNEDRARTRERAIVYELVVITTLELLAPDSRNPSAATCVTARRSRATSQPCSPAMAPAWT